MTYLVAGSTGTVGRHVVKTLHSAGRQVRGLTRDPSTARFPEGVEAVRGDLAVLDGLAEALEGVVGVHLVGFGGAEPHAPLDNGGDLVDLIEAAGVQKVTMSGAWEESSLEPAVRASRLEWTHVWPTAFMSNMFDRTDEVRAGLVEAPFVDVEGADVHEGDIGAVCAHALMDEGHASAVYGLTGPERLSLRDKVNIFSEVLRRDIRLVELTPEQARAKMESEGVPTEMIDFALSLYSDSEGLEEYNMVNTVVEQVTGRPARTFARWIADNAARFQP